MLLKNPGRIEALFTLYFPGLLVQALIECELRTAMRRARITELPLYPEERRCKRPTTEQVLRLFSHTERHVLLRNGRLVQVFRSSTPNSPTCRSRSSRCSASRYDSTDRDRKVGDNALAICGM